MADRGRRGWHALLCALLALTAAGLLSTLVLQLRNTLHDNGHWRSSKIELSRAVLGAVAFLTTRKALYRNRLDLGVWFAHQEVLFRDPVVLDEVAFRMRLTRGGYLVALLEQDDHRFAGVRLSADPARPSACLVGTTAGRFTTVQRLATPPLDARWHRVRASAAAGRYDILLDGDPVGSCAGLESAPTRVGFRGGPSRGTLVDDVEILTADGARFREDFRNRRGRGAIAAASLLAVLAAAALAAVAPRGRHTSAPAAPWLRAETALASLAVVFALLLAADTAVLGRRTIGTIDFRGYESRIETDPQARRRLAAAVPPHPPAGARRILFLGSSQTWGAGAADAEDVWIARLERLWNPAPASATQYELINAGISGLRARRVRELYETRWRAWKPDAIVVVLGANDRDPAVLSRELVALAGAARNDGAHVVFVPEPESTERRYRNDPPAESQAAVRDAAARADVPLLEVHASLAEASTGGFLWWDRVHLTSYGHERMAELVDGRRDLVLGPLAND